MGMGNREEQPKKRNTEFQCAYKNAKPERKKVWGRSGALALNARRDWGRGPGGCVGRGRLWKGPVIEEI